MDGRRSQTRTPEERWLSTIREIASRTFTDHEVDLYLFGSRARGASRTASDIDVAVDAHAPLPIGALPHFREALEESTIPVRIDVVDLAEAGEKFRERVRREGIRWSVSKSA